MLFQDIVINKKSFMLVNMGFFVSKLLHLIDRPSLRECDLSPDSRLGYGIHCINVKMGRYSYMGNKNVIVNTQIGAFCSIASYCCIGGGNHPVDRLSTSPLFYKGRNIFGKNFSRIPFNSSEPVNIGNDVWIGEKVFIKDGITIGDGAIIGAHSVVTHDVAPYAIVAGTPAKLIRYRFDKGTIDYLLQLKWWLLDECDIRSLAENLGTENITERRLKEVISMVKNSKMGGGF